MALVHLGLASWDQGCFEEAIIYYQQGLGLFREVGDREGEGRPWSTSATWPPSSGGSKRQSDSTSKVLAIMRAVGDRYREGITLNVLAAVFCEQQRFGEAEDCYQQSLTIRVEVGDRFGEAWSLWGLGRTAQAAGQHRLACTYWNQAVQILTELGAPHMMGGARPSAYGGRHAST